MIEDCKVFYIESDVDVEYLRKKLASDLESAEKTRKQLELLEDAVVVYKLQHGNRE